MKKILVATGCVIFSVMSASTKVMAADLNFSQFFVFGDSLSDTGNTFTATRGTIPVPFSSSGEAAYSKGRFSNDLIWVDYFGEQIGKKPTPFASLPLNPSLGSQGVNFAAGGAQTGESSPFRGFEGRIPGVLGQVGLFSLQPNLPANSNPIYSIFGGSNDYFAGNTDVDKVVKNLTDSIGLLTQKNAKNFLVFNLPDIGDTPLVKTLPQGSSQALNGLVQLHNTKLASALTELRTRRPDLNIYSVDVNTLFKTARAPGNPFGFEDVENPCVTGNFSSVTDVCDNPNSLLFFDGVHPSSEAHRLIANAALASIKGGNKSIPEPSMGLGLLTLAGLGATRVVKRNNKKLILK